MKQEEAVKIFDMVVKEHLLPDTPLDKLVTWSFMGAAAVKFYRAKVKLMDQLGATEEQRRATLADGQDAGEMLLNIEAKIGELSYQEEQARGAPKRGGGSTSSGQPPKHERLGLRSDQAMVNAQKIHRNPAAVAAIMKEARDNEDIPTKTAVLNKIKADKAEKAHRDYMEKVKGNQSSSMIAAKGEAAKYLSKLREVVLILPSSCPKEGWSDGSFAEARAMVEIIRKRLEVWDGGIKRIGA